MSSATPPYRWCTLYVDTADLSAVVAATGRLLVAAPGQDVIRVAGFTVDVRRNPDRTGGPHFLDWPTVIELDAEPAVPDREVVGFVRALLGHLRSAGHRVAAECDFAGELPPQDLG